MIKDRMLLSKEYTIIHHYVQKHNKAVANKQEAKEILDFNIEDRRQKFKARVDEVNLRKKAMRR